MTNLEKYNKAFMSVFRAKEEELKDYKYRSSPKWDSVGHMELITELEALFNISISTADVLDIYSYEKGIEVLAKYQVEIGEQ